MNAWTRVTGDWKVAEPVPTSREKACATRSVDILVREFRGLSSPQFKNSVELHPLGQLTFENSFVIRV